MDIQTYLQIAKKYDKSNKIILGYTYNNKVYFNILDDFITDRVCFKKASPKNGGDMVLALKPLTLKHKQILLETAVQLCDINEFDSNRNKGDNFERKIRELNGFKHKHDSLSFFDGSDMVIDGIGYSIKWENGQLYKLKVLDRLANN